MAIGVIGLFGVFGASCSAGNWVEQKIDQLMCSHENGVYTTEYVAATCTEDGRTEGTKCVDCDAWIVKGDVLPALGHVTAKVDGFAATCLTDGMTDGTICEACGEVLIEQKVIKATGHKVQDLDAKQPTILEDGHKAGRACINCGTVYSGCETIKAIGLDYFAVTSGDYAKTEIELGKEKIAGNVYRFVIAKGGSFELRMTLSTGDIDISWNYLGMTDDLSMFAIPGFEDVILYNQWSDDGYEYYDIYFPEVFAVTITEDNWAECNYGDSNTVKEALMGKTFLINADTVLENVDNSGGYLLCNIYRLDSPAL